MDKLFDSFDPDGSGTVDYNELNKALKVDSSLDTSTISQTGTALGEVGFVFGMRQEATFLASGRVTCLSLTRADFTQLLADFPAAADAIYANVLAHLRMEGADADEASLTQMLQSRKTEVVGQLLNAASEGDLMAVKNLHSIGVDLDRGDYDLRTACHLAASKGQLDVLQYLALAGANPEPVDRWGNRPIDDAKRNNHQEAAAKLATYGEAFLSTR